MWHFEWLRRWDEVWDGQNVSEWRAAFAPDRNAHVTPFMHPEFALAWLDMVGCDDVEPFFLRARHDDGRTARCLLVRPLPDWRQTFLKTLVPVGGAISVDGPLADYQEPLLVAPEGQDCDFAGDFWIAFGSEMDSHAGSWFDVMRLHGLRSSEHAIPKSRLLGQAPILRLGSYPDGASYLASRSKKLRKDLRRSERNLADLGEVTFRVYDPGEQRLVIEWLPQFLAERYGRYPARAKKVRDLATFYASLVRRAMHSGLLNCSSLMLDGRPISWEINLQINGVLYGYSCAFDSSFKQVSIGSLHTYKLIEWLIRNGGDSYDFMRGDEEYKARWTNGEAIQLNDLQIASRAPSALLRRVTRRGLLKARLGIFEAEQRLRRRMHSQGT
jgi:hypothetical protein